MTNYRFLAQIDEIDELPIALNETFDNDKNGWDSGNNLGHDVSIQDGGLLIFNWETDEHLPLFWTCDACGSFDVFSYQVDIQTPKNESKVFAGIYFGSPTRIDAQNFSEACILSLYSSGAVLLSKISPDGININPRVGS